MKKEVAEALEKSIQKWEKIVAGEGVDEGPNNCALCKLFSDVDCYNSKLGVSCPASDIESYLDGCCGTPWEEWRDHHEEKHGTKYYEPKKVECRECKRLAKKELEFLKSLREKKKVRK